MAYDPYTRPPSMRPVYQAETGRRNPLSRRYWMPELIWIVVLGGLWWLSDGPRAGLIFAGLYSIGRVFWFLWDLRRYRRWQESRGG